MVQLLYGDSDGVCEAIKVRRGNNTFVTMDRCNDSGIMALVDHGVLAEKVTVVIRGMDATWVMLRDMVQYVAT